MRAVVHMGESEEALCRGDLHDKKEEAKPNLRGRCVPGRGSGSVKALGQESGWCGRDSEMGQHG